MSYCNYDITAFMLLALNGCFPNFSKGKMTDIYVLNISYIYITKQSYYFIYFCLYLYMN